MSVTLKDIARLAGVSESTVSLALNGKNIVKAKTKEHILAIAEEQGYMPNVLAKSLARRQSGTIGLVVPDIENPFYGRFIRCVDDCLAKRNYTLLVATSKDQFAGEKRVVETFIAERVEGILIAPVHHPVKNIEYLSKLTRNGIPFLYVVAYYADLAAPCVMTDLEKGAFEMTDYLIRSGHRSLYYLVGNREAVPTQLRIKGYYQAFAAHHLPVDENKLIQCAKADFTHAYQATRKLLAAATEADAILTMNDIMALGALRALLEKNIPVPDRISLAGYDNVVFSSVAAIPVTTVEQNLPVMAETAVKSLFQLIGGETLPAKPLLLPPKLIIRESTKSKQENKKIQEDVK
ncbi:MAG: LacI family DNA-binding transcriptional regulator [Clostridiaceae bacterium]|nr:LacI family DNA-binding transcriptional regulator [Clostridiaceae bacterium]